MNVKKPILTGIISLSALAPCMAQRTVQFASESGVAGFINNEAVYFNGVHANLLNEKNNTDIYCGMVLDTDKNVTFETQLENEYSWTNNLSSWIRETFHLSKYENNLTSEVAPVKLNKSFKKLDTFVAPVYIAENDFKERENYQGVGVVLNATYNPDSNNSVKFEAEYTSEPAKNLFNTTFGKLKDNISYVISYIHNF